jgi:hypothetical protein
MDVNIQHDQTKMFQVQSPGSQCHSCGLKIRGNAYEVPKLSGMHCSIDCVEIHLFGTDRCRWCGAEMLDTYSTVNGRLCDEECSRNYHAEVLGDKTAAIGTAKRLTLWLTSKSKGERRSLVRRIATPKMLAALQKARQARANQPIVDLQLPLESIICTEGI